MLKYTAHGLEYPVSSAPKLDSALNLAGKGFRVFPLEINGKTPAITGDWQKIATTDPDKIRAMWRCPVFGVEQDFNVGVALDANTLVVDVDVRDGKKGAESLKLWEASNAPLPVTYTVQTASGGLHLHFGVPGNSGSFQKELCKHVDLKGAGGYVVGPGSEIDGDTYAVLSGTKETIADAPRWLCDVVANRRIHDRGRIESGELAAVVDLDTPDAIARAKDWLANSAPDNGTFKVACRLKDFGVSQDMCLELMFEDWAGADSRDTEHIAFRVANAYRYGQNAPGIRSPEAEFDAVEIAEENPAIGPKRGLYAVRWSEAKPVLDRRYLIDDIFDLGSMAVTYGDSNSGKTYVVLDQAFAIATGREWNGHKVKQGLVVYVAAEGGTGFYKRIEAYRRTFGATELPFSLIPCPIDLHSTGDAGDTERLVRLIRTEEAHFATQCVLVVIDTLARAIGGGDENTSVDMGLLVRHCDRIRAATGAMINLIHHTGKDKSKGARGSSALRAATDTEIEIFADDSKPGCGEFRVRKQRDMERTRNAGFELRPIEIGIRADGKPITACTVAWRPAANDEFEPKLTGAHQPVWEAIEALFAAEEKAARSSQLTYTAIVSAVRERIGPETTLSTAKGRFKRSLPNLIEQGLLKQNEANQYVRGSANV